MANPRKFSEKIALHTSRQAEETARFEQIMKEVSDATSREEIGHCASTSTSPSGGHSYRTGCRARSTGGPIRRPHDRKLDTSPYSSSHNSNSFLSPPHDTSWRRTNSDSALHQSAMQMASGFSGDNITGGSGGSTCTSAAQSFVPISLTSGNMNDLGGRSWIYMNASNGGNGGTMIIDDPLDQRSRSSCDVPRVPGIHIYPSAHVPGTIQIPISGNNTGSLPDLTNVDFRSPIHMPIDTLDHDQGSSPYSSSPVNTSPSTLSPTSLQQNVRQSSNFHSNLTSNHLSVPVNSRYPSQPSGQDIIMDSKDEVRAMMDGSGLPVSAADMVQKFLNQSIFANTGQTSPSSTTNPSGCYRSPRPSPQSSPSLGGRNSAPCSPGAPSPLPAHTDYSNLFNNAQATQFQQHFEQLSMLDSPLNNVTYAEPSSCSPTNQNVPLNINNCSTGSPTSSIGGMMDMGSASNDTGVTMSGINESDRRLSGGSVGGPTSASVTVTPTSTIDLIGPDAGYYSTSPSQLMYPTAPTSLHTTPNTPTSIPDIIFTDFSACPGDLSVSLNHNSHTNNPQDDMSKHFDGSDLFSDDSLRESLGPLDFDSIQLLSDPAMNLISDSVEDQFRSERS